MSVGEVAGEALEEGVTQSRWQGGLPKVDRVVGCRGESGHRVWHERSSLEPHGPPQGSSASAGTSVFAKA